MQSLTEQQGFRLLLLQGSGHLTLTPHPASALSFLTRDLLPRNISLMPLGNNLFLG